MVSRDGSEGRGYNPPTPPPLPGSATAYHYTYAWARGFIPPPPLLKHSEYP